MGHPQIAAIVMHRECSRMCFRKANYVCSISKQQIWRVWALDLTQFHVRFTLKRQRRAQMSGRGSRGRLATLPCPAGRYHVAMGLPEEQHKPVSGKARRSSKKAFPTRDIWQRRGLPQEAKKKQQRKLEQHHTNVPGNPVLFQNA